jgi:putative DNA primase/helicase
MADDDDEKVVHLASRRKRATEVRRYSDESIAVIFAERYVEFFRYVDDWGQWRFYVTSEGMWRRDNTQLVKSEVRRLLVELSADVKPREMMRLQSVTMMTGTERMLRTEQTLAAEVDQWDADAVALDCKGLVFPLDEDIGERYAVPGDFFTKSTAVRPDWQADCPLWMGFLDLVTGGDADLMDFLQRMAGYCLTGSTKEQCLFFVYGPGGNGKSTFVNTLAGVMGDYAKTAAIETFTQTASDRHPTDLADLQGARLVVAMEAAQGKHWDETRIKLLTGGDRIKARFMRQDFFEFQPVFKLIISGNSKPELTHVDDAMRRRVVIVPFIVKIDEAVRIRGYEARLQQEWPAILAWMIEGARIWHRIGLQPPDVVKRSTDEYLENEDTIGIWLDERTTVDLDAFETRNAMFTSFAEFCKAAHEKPGSRKQFVQDINARPGMHQHMRNGQRGWFGRRLAFELAQ